MEIFIDKQNKFLLGSTNTVTFTVLYSGISGTPDEPSNIPDWLTLTSTTPSTNTYTYTFTVADGGENKVASIKFSAEGVSLYGNIITIRKFEPFIKELIYTSNEEDISFSIIDNNENTLFTGKAIGNQPSNNIQLYINNLLRTNVTLENLFKTSYNGGTLSAVLIDNSTGKALLPIAFAYDYINTDSFDNRCRNLPTSDGFIIGSKIYISALPTNTGRNIYFKVFYNDGTTVDKTFGSQSFNQINTFSYTVEPNVNKIEMWDSSILINTFDRLVCSEYYLLYVNRLGAIDYLPINTNLITNNTFSKSTIINNRYEKAISTTVAKNYSFSTEWLTDYQSEILANNLFQSNNVVLSTPEGMKEVIVSTNAVETKKFRNGRKLIQYAIELTDAKSINIYG